MSTIRSIMKSLFGPDMVTISAYTHPIKVERGSLAHKRYLKSKNKDIGENISGDASNICKSLFGNKYRKNQELLYEDGEVKVDKYVFGGKDE